MKNIYLCGPVSGREYGVAFEHFYKIEQKLCHSISFNSLNAVTINPMRICPKGIDWIQAMRLCVKELSRCDGIALLNGWQNSKGALIEIKLAQDLHIPVIFIETGEIDYLSDLFKAAPESLRYFNAGLVRLYNTGIDESLAECRSEAELVNRYLDPYGFEYIEITEGE